MLPILDILEAVDDKPRPWLLDTDGLHLGFLELGLEHVGAEVLAHQLPPVSITVAVVPSEAARSWRTTVSCRLSGKLK
jgi:hypothetical protein